MAQPLIHGTGTNKECKKENPADEKTESQNVLVTLRPRNWIQPLWLQIWKRTTPAYSSLSNYLNIVDPWTARVHLYTNFFNKYGECVFSYNFSEHFLFCSLLYHNNPVYKTYNTQIRVNRLLLLPVMAPINSQLLVKFWGSPRSYAEF